MREFSPLAFAEHLLVLSAGVAKIEDRALEKCAKVIERDAKNQIGFYQDAVGPFQDWAELAESTEADKARKGYATGAPLLRDGTLRNSIMHEVGRAEAVIGSMSDIAAYQEFGTSTIPPRPFIGPAAYKSKEKIQKILGNAAFEGVTGGMVAPHQTAYEFDI